MNLLAGLSEEKLQSTARCIRINFVWKQVAIGSLFVMTNDYKTYTSVHNYHIFLGDLINCWMHNIHIWIEHHCIYSTQYTEDLNELTKLLSAKLTGEMNLPIH